MHYQDIRSVSGVVKNKVVEQNSKTNCFITTKLYDRAVAVQYPISSVNRLKLIRLLDSDKAFDSVCH